MKIIKNKTIIEDDWQVLRLDDQHTPDKITVPEGKVIVPLKVWLAQQEILQARENLGVWLASDERPEELADHLQQFNVIAVDFPKFSDGRGYSLAYNLRSKMGYKGELRAIGDVLRDQLFYMQRVGFDAFEPRPDRSIEEALKGFADFSDTYQTSNDQPLPLFRRVKRQENTGASSINE